MTATAFRCLKFCHTSKSFVHNSFSTATANPLLQSCNEQSAWNVTKIKQASNLLLNLWKNISKNYFDKIKSVTFFFTNCQITIHKTRRQNLFNVVALRPPPPVWIFFGKCAFGGGSSRFFEKFQVNLQKCCIVVSTLRILHIVYLAEFVKR